MASRKDRHGRVLQKGEFQRKDGRYQFSYCTIIGKRCYFYAKDLAELRRKERELLVAQWHGVDLYGTQVTMNFMYDRSIALKTGLKPSTKASYLQSYDNYVRDEIGRKPIKNIKHSDVVAFYNHLVKDKGLSIKTVQHVHIQVYAAFKIAVQDEVIFKNPAECAFGDYKRACGLQDRKIKALTLEEQKAFVNFIDGHPVWGRYHSIFTFLLGTGLRSGELCGLRWQDVNIDERYIDINHNLVSVKRIRGGEKDHLTVTTPKTRAGIRKVPLMDPVIEALKEEYKIAEAKGFKTETIDGYTDFVFTKQNGTAYTCSRLDEALTKIVRDYNKQEEVVAAHEKREPLYLPHISNHMLRHTFCTRLCERDVNVKVIQTIMGHASVKITLDIYAEVSSKKQAEEIFRMAEELDVF